MSGDGRDVRAEMELEAAAFEKAQDAKRRDFLLAVVNGDDRADSQGRRDYFFKRYVGWFPPLGAFESLETLYRHELHWWRRLETNDEHGIETHNIPMEEFHPQLGPHVAILRYKLKVIWKTAESDHESAERRVGYLRTGIRQHLRGEWGCIKHYSDVSGACKWLEQNVKKLKICRNPECTSPFFFREEKNQRYCCTDCADEGRRLGWQARRKETTREFSPESRQNISQTQTQRHAEAREARKALENENRDQAGTLHGHNLRIPVEVVR
jgi:hypothetical protein